MKCKQGYHYRDGTGVCTKNDSTTPQNCAYTNPEGTSCYHCEINGFRNLTDKNGNCVPIDIPNCKSTSIQHPQGWLCEDNGICVKCNDGYVLYEGTCQKL